MSERLSLVDCSAAPIKRTTYRTFEEKSPAWESGPRASKRLKKLIGMPQSVAKAPISSCDSTVTQGLFSPELSAPIGRQHPSSLRSVTRASASGEEQRYSRTDWRCSVWEPVGRPEPSAGLRSPHRWLTPPFKVSLVAARASAKQPERAQAAHERQAPRIVLLAARPLSSSVNLVCSLRFGISDVGARCKFTARMIAGSQ
jgi:hypothetical protein